MNAQVHVKAMTAEQRKSLAYQLARYEVIPVMTAREYKKAKARRARDRKLRGGKR